VRVLFDHNLPHKLRISLGALGKHEMVTASYMGWGDLKNGELLRTAEESGIEVLVTGDQSLLYEQNLTG
jgi:predicted nuclease of predicted toxin-antitoxin system